MDKLQEKMIHKKIEIDLSGVSEKDKKIYIDKLMKKAKELNLAYIVINDIKK